MLSLLSLLVLLWLRPRLLLLLLRRIVVLGWLGPGNQMDRQSGLFDYIAGLLTILAERLLVVELLPREHQPLLVDGYFDLFLNNFFEF